MILLFVWRFVDEKFQFCSMIKRIFTDKTKIARNSLSITNSIFFVPTISSSLYSVRNAFEYLKIEREKKKRTKLQIMKNVHESEHISYAIRLNLIYISPVASIHMNIPSQQLYRYVFLFLYSGFSVFMKNAGSLPFKGQFFFLGKIPFASLHFVQIKVKIIMDLSE